MFLADDIVLFPVKSILAIFREIHNAAMQELAEEADRIRAELGELYKQLESGSIDDEAFDTRERVLLDRLDVLEARDAEDEDEDEDETNPDDEDLDDEEDELDEEDEDDDETDPDDEDE